MTPMTPAERHARDLGIERNEALREVLAERTKEASAAFAAPPPMEDA